MKKFLLSAAAASMVAIPLAAAAPAEAAPRHQTSKQVVKHTVKHKANGRTVTTQRKVVRAPAKQTVRYQTTYRPGHATYRPAYAAQHRSWARGQHFDYRYAPRYRVVNDYRGYNRLYTPPRGYHWVQSGNDAVLVAIASGLIGAVIGGAFLN
ncbi:RcnB family protein [Hephaestia sp. GCM10023244]|uniref:RcnB family protein n=1 Tax=unclassified Hephaestia TaxID=2631281 RepID=UPI00207710AB|nr:RcnB family protein [Hephaestia sp. MAHUQ-44]MCM8732071.1 RcnB family protein [Hephaestia sp. MAHUQ-44]